MRPYVIRQGDYMTQLAHRLGFDETEVWNHDKNSALKARRHNANILSPGDVVWLPACGQAGVSISSGGTHQYNANLPRVSIRITLRNGSDAVANEAYEIEGLGPIVRGRTDKNGVLRFDAPVTARAVRLVLPRKNMHYEVRIGHLDPIEEMSGVRQRLEHLGHYGWVLNPQPDDPLVNAADEERDRQAVSRFQAQNGIEVTGLVDDATRAAIRDAHGG
jgi:hypothetical protein